MAALGDEALFAMLEADGEAIARGDAAAFERGAVAEVVERSAWAKVEVVSADEREHGAAGGRITLNLGHSIGHALEAADGYATLLHGEAVAYGLRAATRIGRALDVTPADRRRADRAAARPARARRGAAPLLARGRARGDSAPTRSTRAAACAGSSRPPTASSCATTCPTRSCARRRPRCSPATGRRAASA